MKGPRRRDFLYGSVAVGSLLAMNRGSAADSLLSSGPGGVTSFGSLISPKAAVVASYTGTVDIVPTPVFAGGLRAATATIAATGTQKCDRLRRASDNTETDIVILTTGKVDTASALSFAGTDVTGNATSAGTSVALTGLAATAHVGDTIAGAGFLGTYITAVGALVAGAQTVTTNTSQSIGVAEPVTLTWGLYVPTLYKQTGPASDLTQATAANQPMFVSDGGPGGAPAIIFTGNQVLSGTQSGSAQPISVAVVGKRNAGFTTQVVVVSSYTGGTSNVIPLEFDSNADKVRAYAGTDATATAIDSSFHAMQFIGNTLSSLFNVDGTETPGLNVGTGSSGNILEIGGIAALGFYWQGAFNEATLWNSAPSSGNRASLNTNMHGSSGWNF